MNIGMLSAFGSAVLFGLSTPLAKLLVGEISPWLLAGLLYLASGIGLSLLRLLLPGERVPLRGTEWLWLGAAILCGGMLGPVLLMSGLARTGGSTASLLLNAEAVFTALLAWLAFHEAFERRIALGIGLIIAGAVVLSWSGELDFGAAWGPLAVIGACLCWALDNNLTRKVSHADALQIASLKGLVAGSVNTVLALALHAPLPSAVSVALAAAVGFLGYGISLALFVLALRHLGAARTGAYFSAAPFVGALVAVVALGEPLTGRLIAAAALMAGGVWLHLSERHDHEHWHAAVEHEHAHQHHDHGEHGQGEDDHGPHDHGHVPAVEGQHTHRHRHAAILHRHPHYPDAEHRHPH